MRRTDALLTAVVGALAVFVGVKVGTRRPLAPRLVDVRQASLESAPAPEVRAEITAAAVASSPPPPARDVEQIRARIDATPGTYMRDMLDDLRGQLVRWPDRRETGLRIWVQTTTTVPDWDRRYAQMARDAFDDWARDPLPIRFDFVFDSAAADVRVVWRDRFPPEQGIRVGLTSRSSDPNGWLVSAQIEIAIHDSTGRAIPPDGLTGIMRHEAGHALGLGHSRDPKTKMFPVETTGEITPADRTTLKLLYAISPGKV